MKEVRKNRINDDEHVFIAGMTGSGKTYLLKQYLRGVDKKIFVLDSKGLFIWEEVPPRDQITIFHLSEIAEAAKYYRIVIYRPVHNELNDEFYNAFFKFCYDLKNCSVAVDEVMMICPSPARIPEYYRAILTRGRELNVNVWSATQRPSTIPVVIYSEATHWFIFRLNSGNDRKRMSDFTGYDDFMDMLPKYVFQYWNAAESAKPEKGRLSGSKK